MNKEEFIQSSLRFVDEYKRLPTLKEDSVILEQKGDKPDRLLRAHTRITEFFGNNKDFFNFLIKNNYISLGTISDMTGFSEAVVGNIINNDVQNPNVKARRAVQVFLGYDPFEGVLSSYHNKCQGCKKQCKQWYFVDLHCNAANGYEKK